MKNNSKGFTLIELLAVIVILGVLMIVAIPAMTRYIENSKRDVFVDMAKKYIASARYTLISEGFKDSTGQIISADDLVGRNGGPSKPKIVIPANLIKIENGTNKSPWGKTFKENEWGFVAVKYDESTGQFVYSFMGVDQGGNGITSLTDENDLTRSKVQKKSGTTSFPAQQAYSAFNNDILIDGVVGVDS